LLYLELRLMTISTHVNAIISLAQGLDKNWTSTSGMVKATYLSLIQKWARQLEEIAMSEVKALEPVKKVKKE
jgi:hypothetical protein